METQKIAELIARATRAREHSHSPYSKFAVGAAVLTKKGALYAGCNVENASFGLTCCAERVAVCHAVSEGDREIIAVAVVADAAAPVFPCGACLQVLAEFGRDIEIIAADLKGNFARDTLKNLLPRAFSGDDLTVPRGGQPT